jgi:HrpA-like RNA helicase
MEIDKVFQAKLNQLINQQASLPDAAKVVEIKIKIFEVQVFYMELIEKKLKTDYCNISQFQNFINYIPSNIKSNPQIDKSLYGDAFLIILQILEGHLGEDENNSILVFLPGINEIQELEKTIRYNLEAYNPKLLSLIKICQLHSAISE